MEIARAGEKRRETKEEYQRLRVDDLAGVGSGFRHPSRRIRPWIDLGEVPPDLGHNWTGKRITQTSAQTHLRLKTAPGAKIRLRPRHALPKIEALPEAF